MRLMLATTVSILCVAASASALSQSVRQCDRVLVPTIESVQSDYRLLQAFAKLNSDELYEAIGKEESKSAGGGGSYAGFGADYSESKSKSEFRQKTEKRLSDEKFSMSEEDSRAYYRKGVTAAQVNAWSSCVAQVSDGGAVLLIASLPDRDSFTLTVTWLPQRGVGQGTLGLTVSGGSFAGGAATHSEVLTGRTSKSYEVRASGEQQSARVIANIAGSTDSVLVAKPLPRPQRLVKKTKECLETERCADGRVLACFPAPALRSEIPDASAWLEGPASAQYASAQWRTTDINFGSWTNPECSRATGRDVGGAGWHAKVGSCGIGGGHGWQRCVKVRVEYETRE